MIPRAAGNPSNFNRPGRFGEQARRMIGSVLVRRNGACARVVRCSFLFLLHIFAIFPIC
jgi:hypothetical protein